MSFTGSFTGSLSIAFQNIHYVYEQTIKCTVKSHEFNYSYNKTLLQSGSAQNLVSFATGSDFTPYVTTIGLYDDGNNLLAVAKLSQATPMSSTTDTNYIIRFTK